MSWLFDDSNGGPLGPSIKAVVKKCVAVEYIPVSDAAVESSLNVLIRHKDSFEWMDISLAIPVDSEREYPPQQAPTLTKLK